MWGSKPSASTAFQFVRQLVAAPRTQSRVFLVISLLGSFGQFLDFLPQSLDFLHHVSVAHRFVPRSVGFELAAVQCEVAQFHHPQLPGQPQHLHEQVLEGIQVDLAAGKNANAVSIFPGLPFSFLRSENQFNSAMIWSSTINPCQENHKDRMDELGYLGCFFLDRLLGANLIGRTAPLMQLTGIPTEEVFNQ